jgi:hypothetical protein
VAITVRVPRGASSELSPDRIPHARRQEADAELGDRELRLPDQLVDEQADHNQNTECGGGGDDMEQAVTDAVDEPAAAERDASGCRRRGCAHPGHLKWLSACQCGRSPFRHQNGTEPLPTPRVGAAKLAPQGNSALDCKQTQRRRKL